MLQHFLAALAYRTQKAVRDAPESFADFRAGVNSRTPRELLMHMTSLMGYGRTFFHGGEYEPDRVVTFAEEVTRFHGMLAGLRDDFANPVLEARITDFQFLQGPLADAMTHAGQLAMLRRLAGSPVASENFIHARINSRNVSERQPEAEAPDEWWRPDLPPVPAGPPRREEN